MQRTISGFLESNKPKVIGYWVRAKSPNGWTPEPHQSLRNAELRIRGSSSYGGASSLEIVEWVEGDPLPTRYIPHWCDSEVSDMPGYEKVLNAAGRLPI